MIPFREKQSIEFVLLVLEIMDAGFHLNFTVGRELEE